MKTNRKLLVIGSVFRVNFLEGRHPFHRSSGSNDYSHNSKVGKADEIGCHIITATNDILKKLSLVGKDLQEYSLETVQMFYNDATAAGYTV